MNIADKASKIAKANGLDLVVENVSELIYTEAGSYGTDLFLRATDGKVML